MARLGEDRPETEAGEDVHVVALPGLVPNAVVVRHGLVRAAGGVDDFAVRPAERGLSKNLLRQGQATHQAMASG